MSNNRGLVFYVDGSTRPTNPGNSGFGCHGYLFERSEVKRGSGCPTHLVTSSGYVLKSDTLVKDAFTEVNPLKYFDAFGSVDYICTNNVAEIHAMNFCLTVALEHDVKDVTVFTDSEYVRRSIDEWSEQWIKRNWIKRDGTPVPNAPLLKEMIERVTTLRNKGVELIIHWVKGHSGILGNHKADKLALMGSGYSIKQLNRVENKISDFQGYWKKTTAKHPLLGLKSLIFSTGSTVLPGVYHMVNSSKEEDMVGDKTNDGCYSVAFLPTPEVVIEKTKQWHIDACGGLNTVILLRLEKLFKPEVHEDIIEYPEVAFVRVSETNFDCMYLDKSPLSRELRPVKLAFRAQDTLALLEKIMGDMDKDTSFYTKTDITDILYEKSVKGAKTLCKLKNEFGSGVSSFKVEMEFDGKHKVVRKLDFGQDLLPRNNLKNIEEMEPQVLLITWSDSDACKRYATITKTNQGFCINAAMHTNFIYLK